MWGARCEVQSAGCEVWGTRCNEQGMGCKVQGVGLSWRVKLEGVRCGVQDEEMG